MAVDRESVLDILSMVRHPQEGNDIVSLDLVKDLEIENNNIKFNLYFKAFNDPLKNSIKKAAERALKQKLGDDIAIDIKITAAARPQPPKEPQVLPHVKNIVAIASGKGGVGKSTVAANLAVTFAQQGYATGLIDADIFGPSIPKMFGVEGEKPYAHRVDNKDLIIPIQKYGVKMLSIGFFVPATDATIWRGPMATNALKQLMTDSDWGELDYMFIDLPPGTSDIHLTLVQTVAVTGAIIVSTPQNVALADAIKGISMFSSENINVPVLGLIENMAWFTPEELPNNKYYLFGKEGCKKLADEMNVPLLGQIPIVQGIREGGDDGMPASLDKELVGEAFKNITQATVNQINLRNDTLEPTQKVKISRK
ncbi:MAG: P-loop NTPase [Bacteroidetes bacterium]|jgi:ATP-binding protein involved in chromosome partitioning|nr:P-loop NTPase [Bacteroidota bacterium]